MQSAELARRRRAYQRSHTLATLPTNIVREVENETDEDSERCKLLQHTDSPVHSTGSISELDKISDADDELCSLEASCQKPSKNRRARFQQTRSSTVLAGGSGQAEHSSHVQESKDNAPMQGSSRPKRGLGRVPSTPSILFCKVRDRIRETVFQTSSEWPHAAAIIQERRQRAVDAYEAKLSKCATGGDEIKVEQIPLKDIHSKHKRPRMKSEPIPAVVLTNADDLTPAEAAKLAFRRRSISEDTYDRRPCIPTNSLKPEPNSAGVICSDEDLRAIVGSHKKKKSPTSRKRNNLEPQLSQDSSSSTYSSYRTHSQRSLSSEGGESACDREGRSNSQDYSAVSTSPHVVTPTAGCSQQYPEVILDTRAKDSRKHSHPRRDSEGAQRSSDREVDVVDDDDDDDDDDEEDAECGTPKPVPEVIFDEFGQTWDVYGAEFDPESLGEAIQRHLVRLMQKKAEDAQRRRAQEGQDRDSDIQQHKETKARESMGFLFRFLCLFSGRGHSASS